MLNALVFHGDHLKLSEQFDKDSGDEKSVRDLTRSDARHSWQPCRPRPARTCRASRRTRRKRTHAHWSAGRQPRISPGTYRGKKFTNMADSIWPAGPVLRPLNVAWTSGNGRAILRLQEDRNLVLYKDGKAAYQAPNAFGRGNAAIMQDDGNFVLYDQNNEPVSAPT